MRKFTLLFILILQNSFSQISLPSYFGDHMILQQKARIIIWGWGTPLENVKLKAGWDLNVYETEVNNLGNWEIEIETPSAGGPYEIEITGYNQLKLNDVLIGEVWLASGQSNMEWSVNLGIENGEKFASEAHIPDLRFFKIEKRSAEYPQNDLNGKWEICTPGSMRNFSSVAYFFGEKLQSELDVPIGLIQSAWGGTPAEAWMSKNIFAEKPELKEFSSKLPSQPWGPQKPNLIHNAMIYPLKNFPIAGVIWYQGESNTSNASSYQNTFSALIEDWRNQWKKDFPFYFVQIAPYNYGEGEAGVVVRNEQRKVSLSIPKTSMVVVSDIGNIEDIHPKNKKDVGLRLADQALVKHYKAFNKVVDGPVLDFSEKDKNNILLHFKNGTNLKFTNEDKLFEVLGVDQKWTSVDAIIKGSTIQLKTKRIEEPIKVRFAWGNTTVSNLINKEGLPASSFEINL